MQTRFDHEPLVDWNAFAGARTAMGAGFMKQLGYTRDDGQKAIEAIEIAMRARNAAALVIPAGGIADEASQLGAMRLAAIAERIEEVARHCVEWRHEPDELIPDIVALRTVFQETITTIERETNPLVERVSPAHRSIIQVRRS